jgi:glycosyltransferase involved in cell wall biosynthesis
MRILVDGYWWEDGPHSNRSVLLEIVKNWTREFPQDELIVAAPKSRKYVATNHQPPSGVEVVHTRLPLHPAINTIELPVLARRMSADTILAFNFAAPSKRSAVFLHDVLFQTNPEWFTRIERLYYAAMPILAHKSGSVISTSASERERIVATNPRLQRVVHCGLAVASSLLDADSAQPAIDVDADAFVLCVGRFNVRKNLEVTLRALNQSGLISADFPVVIIGAPSGVPAEISEFKDAIANKSLLLMQHVTDGELKWLYGNCRFFVCLALDEGFGLPVIEAAVLGAAVLASDIPVFRETLGAYGSFVPPHDIDSIAGEARRLAKSSRDSAPFVERYNWQSICECIRKELAQLAVQPQV